jgi:hypothetical protein
VETTSQPRPGLSPLALAAGAAFLVAALAGAWYLLRDPGPPLPPAHFNDTTLKKLGNLYTKYGMAHSNTGPPDEANFKQFIRETDDYTARAIGFDRAEVDKLFTSPRDGKAYKVHYRVRLGDPRKPVPIIHEQAGINGRREVGFAFGTVEEVDEARFRQLFSGR